MNLSFVKRCAGDYEKWFKIVFLSIFLLYIAIWAFTIILSEHQRSAGIRPVLPVVEKDSSEYASLIENMQKNWRFSIGATPETYRVPGYIFFASVVKTVSSGSFFGITLAQIFLVFISAFMIKKIGEFYFSGSVGGLASLFFLVNPVVIVSSVTVMTDILFLFLFISGFYLISVYSKDKFKFSVITGAILFSASMYIRAMGVFALPVFIAPVFISSMPVKKKIISAFAIIFICGGLLLPWMYRNYRATGVFAFTSFKAFNMAYSMVPMFSAWENNSTDEVERNILEKEIGIPISKWRDIKYSSQIDSFTSGIILSHPLSYLTYHSIVSLPFFFSSSIDYTVFSYKSAMHIQRGSSLGAIRLLALGRITDFIKAIFNDGWKLVERIIWLAVYFFVFFAIWQNRKRPVIWIFSFVVIYLALLAGPAANARYAIQAQPFIFILSSAGIVQTIKKGLV